MIHAVALLTVSTYKTWRTSAVFPSRRTFSQEGFLLQCSVIDASSMDQKVLVPVKDAGLVRDSIWGARAISTGTDAMETERAAAMNFTSGVPHSRVSEVNSPYTAYGGVMSGKLSWGKAVYVLHRSYGITLPERVLEISREFGSKSEPYDDGYVIVTPKGNGFAIEEGGARKSSRKPPLAVAPPPTSDYTRPIVAPGLKRRPDRGEAMPKKAAVAEPEEEEATEVEEGPKDYTSYADKPITTTMGDFADWLREEVGDIDEMDADRIVALAGTLRMEFQRSDFNKERRANRKAEASSAEEEDEEEEVTPPRTSASRKPAAKTSTGPKAGAPATKASTTAKRGRPAKAEAPF